MNIKNNILKHHLKNVIFICGSANSGKSTLAKKLANKYNLTLYSMDEMCDKYQMISNPTDQLAMNKKFTSWEEYFSREPEEYAEWLKEVNLESIEFAIIDLIILSKNNQVIFEGDLPVEIMKEIAEINQCVFLLVDYDLTKADFFNREDKQDLYNCIMRMKNPEKTLNNVIETITYNHRKHSEEVKASGIRYFIRNELTNFDELEAQIVQNFNLKNINIS